ncbi:unnamed protein product [Ceutorhynchus assimilis]|uniref:Cytokine-like nuclear factor N-PAC n=1 Tax=Ceutorhynchus assimilis TaxID=467358 RepID=A0A9P0DBU8_9CUCU|nr:unnamed protein product [Ceutorhynchus assimilis]
MKAGFKVGDLVWTRGKNHPVWPARIEPQPEHETKKGHVYVYYFGAKTEELYGWAANSAITKYDKESKAKLSKATISRADLKQGLKEIEEEYNKMTGATTEEQPGDSTHVNSGSEKGDEDDSTSSSSKRTRQPKKKFSIESGEQSTPPAVLKIVKKRKLTEKPAENGGASSSKSKTYTATYVENTIGDSFSSQDLTEVEKEIGGADMQGYDEAPASAIVVGFLGLGAMGIGIVNKLIEAGHRVNLWNRTDEKCNEVKRKADKIQEGLVKVCLAPCDVMTASDIVFNCASDPESAKNNVTDNCGVIHAVDSLENKGFVEMTGIDPTTSAEIGEIIKNKGGRYLEAQLQGSRTDAQQGNLLIMASGDNSLFLQCQSCFRAISKTALYLGPTGVATKIYLIMQMIQGVSLIGLAEGLVMADRCGISGKDIVNIFNMTHMASPFLLSKAQKIVDKDFKQVEQSIKNMQKDIRLALSLSEDLMQPLVLASAGNEVFKHSRKLGFDDMDSSCIYMKARY